jgi:glycosyltransferase involved in cell wall biosynthesis
VTETGIAFIYWGRRGFTRFTLEAAHAARDMGLNAYFSISTSNDLFDEFRQFGDSIFPVQTFDSSIGAAFATPRVLSLRNDITDWLVERRVKAVINLMPHIWSPLVSGAFRKQGIHHAVVIHDAKPHPGDRTGLVCKWLLTDAMSADTVFTLGGFVRSELIRRGIASAERIKAAFMPDLVFPSATSHCIRKAPRNGKSSPLRLLYFGRMLRYKALPLLVDALEILAAKRISVEVTVCGEGDLQGMSARLERLGACIVNKWLTDEEIGQLLTGHDAVVLTHLEASQSGLVSAASGAGLPVVVTPVGGLVGQVQERGIGLVASAVSADAISKCIASLAQDHVLYNSIVDRIGRSTEFSMTQFLRSLVTALPPHVVSHPAGARLRGQTSFQLARAP